MKAYGNPQSDNAKTYNEGVSLSTLYIGEQRVSSIFLTNMQNRINKGDFFLHIYFVKKFLQFFKRFALLKDIHIISRIF